MSIPEACIKAAAYYPSSSDKARTKHELADSRAKLERAKEVLLKSKYGFEIVSGKKQCLDNLMGNKDVAEECLKSVAAVLSELSADAPAQTRDRKPPARGGLSTAIRVGMEAFHGAPAPGGIHGAVLNAITAAYSVSAQQPQISDEAIAAACAELYRRNKFAEPEDMRAAITAAIEWRK